MISRKLGTALFGLVLLYSCQTQRGDVETSALGTEVNFVRRGEGPLLESSNVLLVHFKYMTDDGRVLSQATDGDLLPLLFTRDTSGNRGQFQTVLNLLSVGDSVTFQIPAEDLFRQTFAQPVPDTIDAESQLLFEMGVAQQMSTQEFTVYNNERVAKYNEERLKVEMELLADYVKERDVEPIITESGLHYAVQEKGVGEIAQSGQTVNVKYRGTLLDGTQFDEGVYKFVLGSGSVIPGWDEGIGYLNKGAKAVLYIPSSLAYGSRGGGIIPPDAPLVFEVELLEID